MTTPTPAQDAQPAPLKPCPFCDRSVSLDVMPKDLAYVLCDGCGIESPVRRTDDARSAWNRRASLPQPAVVEVSLPELPDVFDWCYEWDGPYGSREFSSAPRNGRKPDRTIRLFTADQLHARDASILAAVSKELGVEVKGKAT